MSLYDAITILERWLGGEPIHFRDACAATARLDRGRWIQPGWRD